MGRNLSRATGLLHLFYGTDGVTPFFAYADYLPTYQSSFSYYVDSSFFKQNVLETYIFGQLRSE